MIVYKIRHKDTGECLAHINGWMIQAGVSKPGAIEWKEYSDSNYLQISEINDTIWQLIYHGYAHILDDCELDTFDYSPKQIKSSIKIKTIRNRIERTLIIDKLKG